MGQFFCKSEISEAFEGADWRRVIFAEFEAALTSTARPFPCVFGVSGFKTDQLRFGFAESWDAETVGPLLQCYLAQARGFGRHTSLVLFGRPGPVQHLEAYRQQFWQLLAGLERSDPMPRSQALPNKLDSDLWEFCFAGEPIFVVCNTPAHVLRQSRRSTSFMVTFQPRWVFEGITDSDDPGMHRALENVRTRLANYDAVAPAPYLGSYGAPGNREYQQYFIDDTNDAPVCPFSSLRDDETETTKEKGKVA